MSETQRSSCKDQYWDDIYIISSQPAHLNPVERSHPNVLYYLVLSGFKPIYRFFKFGSNGFDVT